MHVYGILFYLVCFTFMYTAITFDGYTDSKLLIILYHYPSMYNILLINLIVHMYRVSTSTVIVATIALH